MFKRRATPDQLPTLKDESSGEAPSPKRVCDAPMKFRARGEPDKAEDIKLLPQRGDPGNKSEMDSEDEQIPLGGPRRFVRLPLREERAKDVEEGKESKVCKELDPEQFRGIHWKCTSAAQLGSGQYKGYRIRAVIEMVNLWSAVEPMEGVREMIGTLWAYAEQQARADLGLNPDYYHVNIDSPNLNFDINRNYFNKNLTTGLNEFIDHFTAVEQSKSKRGEKSVFEDPLTVDITAIEIKGRLPRLSGAGRNRKLIPIRKPDNVYNGALHTMPEISDTLCLFRAIHILIQHHLLADRHKFNNYKNKNFGKQRKGIHEMMDACEIPFGLLTYSLEEYGDKIQDYLSKSWPGTFAIFCFSSKQTNFKPTWKSRTTNFIKEIPLYFNEEQKHYSPIKNAGLIFQEKALYCYKCEIFYTNASRHKQSCKSKCRLCQRVGPGYPCPTQEHVSIYCAECKKSFTNTECYQSHLISYRRGQKSVCQRNHLCPDCGIVFDLENQPPEGHVCNRTWCRFCGYFHQKGGFCKMRFRNKAEKAKRFIIYDFECRTDQKVDPRQEKFLHKANFCWAIVTCTECIENGRWDREFRNDEWCRICGYHRHFAFSSFDIPRELQPAVHVPVVDDTMVTSEFCSWLLNFEAKKFSWVHSKDPREGLHPDAWTSEERAEFLKKRPMSDQEINEEEREVAEEDEMDWEMGIHMGPKRGEEVPTDREQCEEDDEEEADEEEGDKENSAIDDEVREEGGKNKRKKRSPKGKKKEPRKPEFETLVFAHNGGRYDNIFMFGELMAHENICPKMIRQHNRILEMSVKKHGLITNLVFRDSYSLIPLPISKFVESFGLNIPGVEGKMFFPHRYNKAENYEVVNQGPPGVDEYCPHMLKPKDRDRFLKWHAEEEAKGERWVLKEQLVSYCRNDVEILCHGLVAMIKLFRTATRICEPEKIEPPIPDNGIDITNYLTLPSACTNFFLKTLECSSDDPKKRPRVAIVPNLGYEKRHGKGSAIARKFLKWKEHKHMEDTGEPLIIQSWDSPEGEHRIERYSVDGYIRRPGDEAGDLVIEVNGCYWHGCLKCYPDDDQKLIGDYTAKYLRERDQRRLDVIRKYAEVEVIWEHEINEQLEQDSDMAEFFANLPDYGPIDVREAFFGGRTGPEYLACDVRKVNKLAKKYCVRNRRRIKYKDFCSLYPYIMWTTRYPIGHAKVLKWEPIRRVEWKKPEDMRDPDTGLKLEGIIKCWIVPPRRVKYGVPVVPYRSRGRLLFPLCKKCAEKNPDGLRMPGYKCTHHDGHDGYDVDGKPIPYSELTIQERGWLATLTSMELGMALEAGYKVVDLHSAYTWPNKKDWSSDLFQPYLRTMFRLKMEASDWPADVREEGISEEERERRKDKHIAEALEIVALDRKNVKLNPGMRLVAKLCLNSLWGRAKLPRHKVVRNMDELAALLNNKQIEIDFIEPLSSTKWLVGYKSRDEAVIEHGTHNPIIALWTTSAARCHLLRSLQAAYGDEAEVNRRHPPERGWASRSRNYRRHGNLRRRDVRILYMDTDSIIYTYDEVYGDPLPTGAQLGDLTEEFPDFDILAFYATGPKSYLLMLRNKKTGELMQEMKLRAITLDYETCQKLQAKRYIEIVKRTIRGIPDQEVVNKNINFVVTGNKQGILSVPMKKVFKPSTNKGVQLGNRIVPFGYVPCPDCNEHSDLQTHCVCMEVPGPELIPSVSLRNGPKSNVTPYIPLDALKFPQFLKSVKSS